MAEGNGEVTTKNDVSEKEDNDEKIDDKIEEGKTVEKSKDYPKLIRCGLEESVALKLDEIYRSGKNL